jgi:hypothetical protein
MELRKLSFSLRILLMWGWLGLPCVVGAQESAALVLNAGSPAYGTTPLPSPESRTCILLPSEIPAPPAVPNCHLLSAYRFFVQGRRSQFLIYNRKFFTEYSITIDAVTSYPSTPMIRGLDEAATLAISPPSLATPPAAKGQIQTVTARSTQAVLLELLDETTATNIATELRGDRQEIDRDQSRLAAEFSAFNEMFTQLAGAPGIPINCSTLAGAPNFAAASFCLNAEFAMDSTAQWATPPFDGEQAFREVNTRVNDLVAAVTNLSTLVQNTDLVTPSQAFASDLALFEVNLNTYRGNYQATLDAIAIAKALLAQPRSTNFRLALRPEQMRALLSPKLKTDKPVDDVILNKILDDYNRLVGSPTAISQFTTRLDDLEAEALQADPAGIFPPNDELETVRSEVNIALPAAITQVNALQSQLLNRVNYIYDHSEVRQALPIAIPLTSYPGNLTANFTVRRIESFARYTIVPIPLPTSPSNASSSPGPSPLPAPVATVAPTASPSVAAATAAPATATPVATAPVAPPGIVVANGSFDVHERDLATVIAAVAVSTLRDQNVGEMTPAIINPAQCPNATPPVAPSTIYTDPNCFAPINNGTSIQVHGIAGVGFYFRPRDTFPRSLEPPGAPPRPLTQYFGVMGALAVDQVNSYFVGPFWEPFVGLQVSGGTNFGNESILNPVYTFNTPVDLNGSFTTNKQKIGAFFGIGLDLGIFKKVFGQVTGIGQQVGTVGQPPTTPTPTTTCTQ